MAMSITQAKRIRLSDRRRRILDSISPERGPDGFFNFWKFVKTKDEKDHGKIKPFPTDKKYLFEVGEKMVTEPLLLIPKSRQMMISWLAVVLCVWELYTLPYQLILWQSKNEEDANKMVFDKDNERVARASFVISELPAWLFPRPKYTSGNIICPNGSRMRGVQQGPNVIRSESPSRVVSDEMAFQEDAADAYMAARPSLQGGGKFLGISSANIGFFWDCVEDKTTKGIAA